MNCERCERELKTVGPHCEHCLRIMAGSILLLAAGESALKKKAKPMRRGGYRHESESLAVVPEHVEHVRAIYKSSGLGDIEHLPDGRPVFTSEAQFQQANKIRGFKTGRDGYDQNVTGKELEQAKQRAGVSG